MPDAPVLHAGQHNHGGVKDRECDHGKGGTDADPLDLIRHKQQDGENGQGVCPPFFLPQQQHQHTLDDTVGKQVQHAEQLGIRGKTGAEKEQRMPDGPPWPGREEMVDKGGHKAIHARGI